jgi:hypothetical protein
MAVFSTTAGTTGTQDFEVPTQVLDPWLGKIQDASVIASLSGAIPMKFGTGEAFTFSTDEAEHVGEGANKASSTYDKTGYTVAPQKFQKTMRFTEEVLWANEDHQLEVVEQLLAEIQPALSRALDYGIIHGINPRTGAAVAAMSQNLASATVVPAEVEVDLSSFVNGPFDVIDEADALVLANRYVPGDIALDPALAAKFSAFRNPTTFQKMYPNFRLGAGVSELEGHRAAVSRTVRAQNVGTHTSDLLGLVGDFSTVRWGVQKSIGLRVIEYGDPDGAGDLKRNNQVAFRAEVVYGWGVADGDALVRLVDATPEPAPEA